MMQAGTSPTVREGSYLSDGKRNPPSRWNLYSWLTYYVRTKRARGARDGIKPGA